MSRASLIGHQVDILERGWAHERTGTVIDEEHGGDAWYVLVEFPRGGLVWFLSSQVAIARTVGRKRQR